MAAGTHGKVACPHHSPSVGEGSKAMGEGTRQVNDHGSAVGRADSIDPLMVMAEVLLCPVQDGVGKLNVVHQSEGVTALKTGVEAC